jgi:hypothetical protein
MVAGKSVRAGRAFVEMTLRDFVSAGLKKIQAKLKAFAAGVRAAGLAMMKLGAMIVAPLALAGLAFGKMGDTLHKMSSRLGVSVEELSRLSHAAQISGGSIDDLEKGFKGLARFVTDAGAGLSTQARALRVLGLEFKDLKGVSPEDQFKLIADRLSKLKDDSLRTGTALTIFGRAGLKLMPMLKSGAKGIKALGDESDAMGHTMSTEDANAAAILTDAMTKLWNTVKMAVFHIGAGLAPLLTDVADRLREWSVVAMKWIKENRDMVVIVFKIGAGLIAVGVALMIVSPLISIAAVAVGILTGAIAVLQGVLAFMLSPLGIAIGAFVLLAHATGNLGNITKEAGNVVLDGWEKMSDIAMTTFGGITDALMSGEWELAAKIGMAGVKSAWTRGAGALEEAWIGVKFTFLNIVGSMLSGAHKMWVRMTGLAKKTWANIKSIFDESEWGDASAAIDAETRARIKVITDDKNAAVDANNAKAAAGMKTIADESNAAKVALDKLRADAAAAREEHERLTGEQLKPPPLPELPDIDELPGWEGMESAAKKIAASGAFSSAAVARMGGGIKTPEEETAENTEKAVDELNAINNHLHKMNVSGAYSFM